jgi:hypothetical protein
MRLPARQYRIMLRMFRDSVPYMMLRSIGWRRQRGAVLNRAGSMECGLMRSLGSEEGIHEVQL